MQRHRITENEMIDSKLIFIAAMAVFGMSSVWAQEPAAPTMPEMDHSDVQGRTSVAEDRMSGATQMDHGARSGTAPATGHDMGGMDHGSMQGGTAPPDARDPHAYSGGYTLDPARPLRLADEHNFGSLLVDRFESARTSDNSFTTYELQGWFGRDYDRAVFKAEGEVDGGKLHDARTELLWGHALSAYWDTQLGVRYDRGAGRDRGWLAF